MMATLLKYYPDEDHFFIYNNATTHLSQPADSVTTMYLATINTACWLFLIV
jgi:hypothetical protein